MRCPLRRSMPLLVLSVGLFLGLAAAAGTLGESEEPPRRVIEAGPDGPPLVPGHEVAYDWQMRWKEVDRLEKDQRYAAALEIVDEILEQTIADRNSEHWARALVRSVQLETALHGYETAIRRLQDTPWPPDTVDRTIVGLFYAHGLITYLQAYSWEIEQREVVDSDDAIDLKRWTSDQIVDQSYETLAEIWQRRAEWQDAGLGPLAEYLQPNNYPARIRGTLRDTVSYLWVRLLADSSLWSARESNRIHRLDLEALIEPEAEASAVDWDPSDHHPLEAMASVLADLESWHRRQGRPEAAFEARRQRLEHVHAALTNENDRQAILEALESATDELGSEYEWWSTGQATIAELMQQDSADEALIRAREIAMAGAEAHPDSLGGQRCRHLVASIEAPHFDLQAMRSDAPQRRSVLVRHKNLSRLHFRAYHLDLDAEIVSSKDYNLLPGYREVPAILEERSPAANWSLELPPTSDFRIHQTFVEPPVREPGLYVFVASADSSFDDDRNRLAAVHVVIGDLVLLTRSSSAGFEVEVRSGTGGQRLAGVEVELYRYDYRRGHRRVASQRTDEDGLVWFEGSGRRQHRYFLMARRGREVGIDASALWQPRSETAADRTEALIYTDRSVYRPQQAIEWKVVAYRLSAEAKGAVLPDRSLTVELLDANQRVVASREVETNDFGSASGRFEIPSGRLLGQWSLRSSLGGRTPVRVEEYRRPTFEVDVSEPEKALRLNRKATLSGEAAYYFGLPVVDGEIRWRVERVPIFPRWWWRLPPTRERAEVVAVGETRTDAEGRFELEFMPAADERLADSAEVSYRFALRVEVTDDGGETRTAERIFRLGFVAVQASIVMDAGFLRAGRSVEVRVQRSDLDGVPRAGHGSWRLNRLSLPEETSLPTEQPPADFEALSERFATPGDRLRPRWETAFEPRQMLASWQAGQLLRHDTVEHDDSGLARVELEPLTAGAYRLDYSTEDEYGATFAARHDFVVAATESDPLPLPLLLEVEQESVEVGGTARLLMQTGLDDQEMVLEIFRAGQPWQRRLLSSARGVQILELPIGLEDRGGFSVRLSALRDHQWMSLTRSVRVPWADRELELRFASFRDLLRPGAHETWRLEVKGWRGEQLGHGTAELLAYMYDRSLDIFAPHQPPQVPSIYPSRLGVEPLSVSLGHGGEIWSQSSKWISLPGFTHLVDDRLVFFDGYGIGGPGQRYSRQVGGPPALAMRADTAVEEIRESVPEPTPETDIETADSDLVAGPTRTDEGLRSDFSETAFWHPHLVLDRDGSVAFEFTVPDSVTEWNVWAHAVTRDLRGGSLTLGARSAKELMVRPYLPRFLREGDRARLEVVVNNASEQPLSGELDFDIRDPESDVSLLAEFGLQAAATTAVPFSVSAGGSSSLSFEVVTPARVGQVAVVASATAGVWKDGEIRSLPLLPGRMHLSQSRFAALRDRDRRELTFTDMAAGDDPSLIQEQLVVTLDAQLFYSVLQALPYLVSYPYECTEQTLNRFLSTGIVTSLFDDYPEVERMARQLSERDTRLETWDRIDPNRKMALVETPWITASEGGAGGEALINVLDPRVARAERRAALAKLAKMQTSLGGFPWWAGGPPSPYMTLYLLQGFARALEFDVEVPRDMVVAAWRYMHRHYVDEMVQRMMEEDCCWEIVTFLGFVLSSYPDDSWTGGVFSGEEREAMLDFSYRHWRQQSPRLKSYLALTLARAGRAAEARRVFESVMDSSKTTRDEGTFWAPEERAWLWYNDTIESHAFALRALTELDPEDERRRGLVHWLFLNKKLNQWKSTRATAEVIYSLVHYLEGEGELGQRQAAAVSIGDRQRQFVWQPDRFTGKSNQWILPGEELDPAADATVVVEKETPGMLFASATWHFSTERLPEVGSGDIFSVERSFFRRTATEDGWRLRALTEGEPLAVGDQVEVHLSLKARHAAEYVHLRDPRGAGFEPVAVRSGYRWNLGLGWYEEVRDSGTNFFFDRLPAGEYTFKYRLRVAAEGDFRIAPAVLQSMYAPEFTAYSAGTVLRAGE